MNHRTTMNKYTVDHIHNSKPYCIDGPQIGPDTSFGFYSTITFDNIEDAQKAAQIANAAYRAGRIELQNEIKCLLSIQKS
jgi:hypothetical protein